MIPTDSQFKQVAVEAAQRHGWALPAGFDKSDASAILTYVKAGYDMAASAAEGFLHDSPEAAPAPLVNGELGSKRWVIVSMIKGRGKPYWRPNGAGYTDSFTDAGRYSYDEATAIASSCRGDAEKYCVDDPALYDIIAYENLARGKEIKLWLENANLLARLQKAESRPAASLVESGAAADGHNTPQKAYDCLVEMANIFTPSYPEFAGNMHWAANILRRAALAAASTDGGGPVGQPWGDEPWATWLERQREKGRSLEAIISALKAEIERNATQIGEAIIPISYHPNYDDTELDTLVQAVCHQLKQARATAPTSPVAGGAGPDENQLAVVGEVLDDWLAEIGVCEQPTDDLEVASLHAMLGTAGYSIIPNSMLPVAPQAPATDENH